MQAAQKTLNYRHDIDGLRAIAVLLVLIFHFNIVGGGKSGFIGVDVFFVISGFLITSIIRGQLDAGNFSLATFYVNRIRRLAPPLFVVLFLVGIAGAFLLFPKDFEDLAKQIFVSQFYIANIYYWRTINYFGLHGENVFLLHTWSLAVEEQYYLFYPVVLLAVHRHAKRYFWLAIAILCVLSFALNIAFVDIKPEATFYLLPTRAWELLAGGLIPYLSGRLPRSAMLSQILGALGISLIGCAIFFYGSDVSFPGYFALLPVLGALCLILSGNDQRSFSSALLRVGPLVYIGRISYSLYLVHWPINIFAKLLLADGYTLEWRWLMFLVSVGLASVIYHTAEQPLRLRRVLASNKKLLAGYSVGILCTLAGFGWVQATGGLPGRFPSEVVRLANFENDKSPPLSECEFAGQPIALTEKTCLLGVADAKPTWLVFGDSHAWAAHHAFDSWLKSKGESGLFMFRNSCPPVFGVHLFKDRGTCFAFNQSVSGLLGREPGLKNVVLVSTWRQPLEGRLSTSSESQFSPEQSIELFDEKFTQTIDRLDALGKNVYVWEPVPGARENVPLALARAALAGKPANIEIDVAEYRQAYAYFFKALDAQRARIFMSFSPSAALCGSGKCAVEEDGRPLYFDNAHISDSSSDFWTRMMVKSEAASLARTRNSPR